MEAVLLCLIEEVIVDFILKRSEKRGDDINTVEISSL